MDVCKCLLLLGKSAFINVRYVICLTFVKNKKNVDKSVRVRRLILKPVKISSAHYD